MSALFHNWNGGNRNYTFLVKRHRPRGAGIAEPYKNGGQWLPEPVSGWYDRSRGNFNAKNYQVGFRSFATLWGRELSRQAAGMSMGVADLSEDLGARMRDRAEADYWNAIAIEVHLFSHIIHNTFLDRPGTQIQLIIDGDDRYRPASIITGDPVEYEVPARRFTIFHRSNLLAFERFEEDPGLLEGASRIQLIIAGIKDGERRYEWQITSGRSLAEEPAPDRSD